MCIKTKTLKKCEIHTKLNTFVQRSTWKISDIYPFFKCDIFRYTGGP